MDAPAKRKRYTNWRQQLKKFGIKAVRNPMKYCRYPAGDYTKDYENRVRQRLKKKYKIMFPNEII